MSAPLDSIAPLIPLPAGSAAPPPRPPPSDPGPDQREDLTDRFAALFSPPTPPASRTRTPPAPIFRAPSSSTAEAPAPRARPPHARAPSLADDFGAFVSVSAGDDPLFTPASPPASAPASASAGPGAASAGSGRPVAKPQMSSASLAFFENFSEGARAADKDRRSVLDELLAHEDDPLYWIQPEENSAPTDLQALSSSLLDDVLQPEVPHATTLEPARPGLQTVTESLLGDVLESERPLGSRAATPQPATAAPKPPPPPPPPPPETQSSFLDVFLGPSPSSAPVPIARTRPSPVPLSASPPALASTPPTTTAESSSPKLTRNSFSTRWLPALLARPSASSVPLTASASSGPPPTQTPPPDAPPSMGAGAGLASAAGTLTRSLAASFSAAARSPPTSSSLPSLFNVPVAPPPPHPHGHAHAHTHANPFAAHTFVPPSGAPGFGGDRRWAKDGFEFDAAEELGGGGHGGGDGGGAAAAVKKRVLALVGRKEMTGVILDGALADALRTHLPALPRLARTWTLLYSLDQHGISLGTLYARTGAHPGPAVLAVRDTAGATFGAVVGGGVRMGRGAYYGGGESFLWREGAPGAVDVFRWTGRNEYVALCEPEFISFGGGDGHYGLFLDESLLDGSSAPCPTFANPPLCAPAPARAGAVPFECVGLEVWGVGP